MAGAMSLDQAINFSRRMASGVSYRKPLKICQQIMISGIRKSFARQSTPDGRAWPQLKEKTRKRRRKGGRGARILQDRGILMASVTAQQASGGVRQLTDTVAAVGSNVKYAATHNYGDPSRNIPARTFIGHRPENLPVYDDVFAEFEVQRFLKT